MHAASATLCSGRVTLVRSVTFQESRSLNKGRARFHVHAQGSMDGVGLAVLSKRIQQLKAAERQHQWPGYEKWRQSSSNESPWSGFGEWRTIDNDRDEQMRISLRQRISKPSLAHSQDLAEDGDHLDYFGKLDAWHAKCWENFQDSDAFDDVE